MSSDSLIGAALTTLLAAAPSFIASAGASAFQVPIGDYMMATVFSVIGIVARHSLDASREGGSFNGRTFAIDLLTAPMLGVSGYMICAVMEVSPLLAPGVVIGVAYAGPEAVRRFWQAVIDAATGRIGGGR